MAVPTFNAYGWNAGYTYAKWDFIFDSSTFAIPYYFYSTTDNNVGASPAHALGPTCFVPTTSTRTENVVRISFTQTGTESFQQGSIIVVADSSPDPSINYTGTCLAGGSGYADYLNPGLNVTNVISAGKVQAPIHPYWTTGFYWLPTYSTEVDNDMQVINTKLGDGYSQRMNPVINSNSLNWNLVFTERTNKETMAMLNFLQNYGGATPFVINLPVGGVYNTPNLKYISQSAKQSFTSYGLQAVTVPVTQVFDIG